MNTCIKCKKSITDSETYEYRGALSCEDCFDDVIEHRDFERREIIAEESKKTDKLKGFDFGDNAIGKANRELLKGRLEVAGKESLKLHQYERGKK